MVFRRRITGLVNLLPFLAKMVAIVALIINAGNGNLLAGSSSVAPVAYTLVVSHISLLANLDTCHAASIEVGLLSLVNQPPLANDDIVITLQDTSVTFDVLENDYDPDGDPLMVIDTTYSQHGLLIIYPNGTITYLPGPGHYVDTFTYTISDGRGGRDTATVTVKVYPLVPEDGPPDANAGRDQTVQVGTEVTLDGSGSTDPDYDIITYNWYEGSTFLGSGEAIKHTFPLGNHTVRLVVTDSFGQTDSDEVIINAVSHVQEYFTEQLSSYYFDLSYKTIMFTPASSGTSYNVCLQEITQLPTDPAGGAQLVLLDDGYEFISLNNKKTVSIFGSSFPGFYVGSNGYITFTQPDNSNLVSLSNHFATKRISCLFNDLDPFSGGVVSWKQLSDRVVVTWDDVPQYGMSYNYNTFQVQMYFDGRIQLAWPWVSAGEYIVGLSKGLGLPADFQETNFSEYPKCVPVIPQPVIPQPMISQSVPPLPSDYVWKTYNGHRYALTLNYSTWTGAQAEAAAVGGYLAIIDGPDENRWLAEFIKDASTAARDNIVWNNIAWIGLSYVSGNRNSPASWRWVNGEAPKFWPTDPAGLYPFGNHIYLHGNSHAWSPGTWNCNPVHESDPSRYPRGIIEISEAANVPQSWLNYLTEYFSSDTDGFDLSYKAIMFSPTADGTSYSACLKEINQLPTDPAVGAYLYLGDDGYDFVYLNNQKTVSIFGSSFTGFYVSANGYITFTEGDRDSSETLVDHFSTKRISALFNDLNPFEDGAVRWKQLADRAVVSWVDVPLLGMSHYYNTFQVEMYFDGRIQLAWLRISAEECIVGLSDGLGLPVDFQETDFSEYPLCGTVPPVITPIAHWTMDDNAANNYVLDSSGRGKHGTAQQYTSALSVAGAINGALAFNGLSDYVSVPDSPEWTFSGNFTITLWVEYNMFNPKWWESAFVAHDEGPGYTNKWIFSYDSVDSKTLFHINRAGTGGPVIKGNPWAAQTGVWYFIAVTRSGSTYTFYREGISDGAQIDGNVIPNASAPLTIGWAEEFGTFDGALDDIRIYDRALSGAEIAALYNEGSGP